MPDEFAETLGQFCWNFSIIEAQLRSVLYEVMHLTPNTGNAAFYRMPFSEMMNTITRLGETHEWPTEKKGEWTNIQSQLALITTLRNHILHYGAYKMGTDYVVSNQQVIHIPERLSAIKISRQTLLDASDDLAQADARINLLFRADGLHPDHIEHLGTAPTSSWRYRQPPQAWSRDKIPKTTPKLRKSSPGSRQPPDSEK